MISLQELNPHAYPTTPTIDANLAELLKRINVVRTEWAQPMGVSSGLRSQADQDALIAHGKSNAFHSNHLTGSAVDIADPLGQLQRYLKLNPSVLEKAQLWCEEATKGWCHFQTVRPKSGNRWFYA